MEERPCVFCQIAKKQIPSKIVYEDEFSMAFLDVMPRSKGMCIVIPKQHYKSQSENFELSEKVFRSAMAVAEMIKQTIRPKSVSFSIIESEAIPHFHIRVYPVYENEIPLMEAPGKEVDEEELNAIANNIRSVKIEMPKPQEKVEEKKEVKEEKPKEEEREEEEVSYIRREMELT